MITLQVNNTISLPYNRDYADFTLKLTYDENASKQPPTGPFVPSKESNMETATYTAADCPEAIVFYRICEQDFLNEVTFQLQGSPGIWRNVHKSMPIQC